MQKCKGFVSAVMFVMTLAMVACASTRTQKSAGEQVDDTVMFACTLLGPGNRFGPGQRIDRVTGEKVAQAAVVEDVIGREPANPGKLADVDGKFALSS